MMVMIKIAMITIVTIMNALITQIIYGLLIAPKIEAMIPKSIEKNI